MELSFVFNLRHGNVFLLIYLLKCRHFFDEFYLNLFLYQFWLRSLDWLVEDIFWSRNLFVEVELEIGNFTTHHILVLFIELKRRELFSKTGSDHWVVVEVVLLVDNILNDGPEGRDQLGLELLRDEA